jgi:hypothetical protein
MKYYLFDFFAKLSIQEKINFKEEYSNLYKKKIFFISYIFQSQNLISRYRKMTVL